MFRNHPRCDVIVRYNARELPCCYSGESDDGRIIKKEDLNGEEFQLHEDMIYDDIIPKYALESIEAGHAKADEGFEENSVEKTEEKTPVISKNLSRNTLRNTQRKSLQKRSSKKSSRTNLGGMTRRYVKPSNDHYMV